MDRIKSSVLPNEDNLCENCRDILIQPKVCSKCEHIICYRCLNELKLKNRKCFNTNCISEELKFEEPIKKWLKVLNESYIVCQNIIFGCQEIVKFGDLENHESKECLFRKILCTNEGCGSIIIYDKIKEHYQICEFENVFCLNEGCNETYKRINQDDHLMNCLHLPTCNSCCVRCKIEKKKNENLIFNLSNNNKIQENEFKIRSNEMTNDIDKFKNNCLSLEMDNINKSDEIEILKNKIISLERDDLYKSNQIEELKNKIEILEKGAYNKSKEINNMEKEINDLKQILNMKKDENIQVINSIDKICQFDSGFSKNYYTFQDNYKKAIWNCSSSTIGIHDFQHYPVARIQYFFTSGLRIKFIMKGYGWFGIGSKDVSCEGFPGYTKEGWVIRNSNGGLYHNDKGFCGSGTINCDGKETLLIYNNQSKTLEVSSGSQKMSFCNTEMPNEVYFIVSVCSGTSITLIDSNVF